MDFEIKGEPVSRLELVKKDVLAASSTVERAWPAAATI